MPEFDPANKFTRDSTPVVAPAEAEKLFDLETKEIRLAKRMGGDRLVKRRQIQDRFDNPPGGFGLDRHPARINFFAQRHDGRVGVDLPNLDFPTAKTVINAAIIQAGQPESFFNLFRMWKIKKEFAFFLDTFGGDKVGGFGGPLVAEQNVAWNDRVADFHGGVFAKNPIANAVAILDDHQLPPHDGVLKFRARQRIAQFGQRVQQRRGWAIVICFVADKHRKIQILMRFIRPADAIIVDVVGFKDFQQLKPAGIVARMVQNAISLRLR
jgi:hypothetical protein